MKPEKRLLQVGDIVKIREGWDYQHHPQRPGDVGVVASVLHRGSSTAEVTIVFARTGLDPDRWMRSHWALILVTPVEDTSRG